ncbi:hypothetical protein [Priestia megaterium]|uniref:hypothetical protein n=1 Tax=Priestia megaterium TaxID=1404 RepID=UPI000BF28F7D|nr:hypothetical protein [Priestia megaterium]PFR94858.1 hypothetical protein COK39_15095 [Priestia megaterium]
MTEKEKTIQEKVAAESKSIGFDYQYYYFFYALLKLESGESLGYEVRDDVHIEKTNGEQILIQLKHSVETKADGSIINLSEKDIDLWKTVSNWIDMINDKSEQRTTESIQLKYINNTHFILITNKPISKSNKFLEELVFYQEGAVELDQLKKTLTIISTPSKGKKISTVDTYIKKLLQQEDKWLAAFFNRLSIKPNMDELIELIKMRIKEKNVSESRVEDVYSAIDSRLRKLIFEDVKKGKKIVIDFSEYYKLFTKYFELGRSRKLPIRLNYPKQATVQNPENHTSIKQLIDIEIISPQDYDYDDTIVEIFICKYLMHNNLERWLQDVDITEEQKHNFEQEAIKNWSNKFNSTYSRVKRRLRNNNIDEFDQDELLDLAAQCYYATLELSLLIDETELDIRMSNGFFYLLSDRPSIGWYYNWKDRYKSS